MGQIIRPINKQYITGYFAAENTILTYAYSRAAGLLFTARRSALHGLCGRNSVRPSVRPSVTVVHCVHMV